MDSFKLTSELLIISVPLFYLQHKVAGIRFTFDPNKEAASRVLESTVYVDDELISKEKVILSCVLMM